MLCKKCGKENDARDLYCVYCGALLESEKRPEAPEKKAEEPEKQLKAVKEPIKESGEKPGTAEEIIKEPEENAETAKENTKEPEKRPETAEKKTDEPGSKTESEEKKPSQKKVSSSVRIAVGIILLLGIAFLATGYALGLFNDIGEMIGNKVNTLEARKVQGVEVTASTLTEAVFDEAIFFDCTSQTGATMEAVLGDRTISQYALADLNGDKKKELILRMADKENASGSDDLMEVLHAGKNGVLGKVVSFREMQLISETGTFKGNVDTETSVYYEMKIKDDSMEALEFARGTLMTSMIAQRAGEELAEVSLEEFTKFVNKRFGARTVGFKEYSEEELRKDLENPDGYDLIELQDMGMAYWGIIIPELAQYNDLIGSTYSKFEKRENYVYSDDAKWGEDAERLLCCATGDDLKYVGTDDSIYEAEYLGVRDDAIIMSGAATDVNDTLAQDFILSDEDFANLPAKFRIREAEGKDKGTTALVWSCGDTYLCIFVEGDTEDMKYYDRPVTSVCYIMKDCSRILGYPQILD